MEKQEGLFKASFFLVMSKIRPETDNSSTDDKTFQNDGFLSRLNENGTKRDFGTDHRTNVGTLSNQTPYAPYLVCIYMGFYVGENVGTLKDLQNFFSCTHPKTNRESKRKFNGWKMHVLHF